MITLRNWDRVSNPPIKYFSQSWIDVVSQLFVQRFVSQVVRMDKICIPSLSHPRKVIGTYFPQQIQIPCYNYCAILWQWWRWWSSVPFPLSLFSAVAFPLRRADAFAVAHQPPSPPPFYWSTKRLWEVIGRKRFGFPCHHIPIPSYPDGIPGLSDSDTLSIFKLVPFRHFEKWLDLRRESTRRRRGVVESGRRNFLKAI